MHSFTLSLERQQKKYNTIQYIAKASGLNFPPTLIQKLEAQ